VVVVVVGVVDCDDDDDDDDEDEVNSVLELFGCAHNAYYSDPDGN